MNLLRTKLNWQDFEFQVLYCVHDRVSSVRDAHAHDDFYELVVVREGAPRTASAAPRTGSPAGMSSSSCQAKPTTMRKHVGSASTTSSSPVNSLPSCWRSFRAPPRSAPIWGCPETPLRGSELWRSGTSTVGSFFRLPNCSMKFCSRKRRTVPAPGWWFSQMH